MYGIVLQFYWLPFSFTGDYDPLSLDTETFSLDDILE